MARPGSTGPGRQGRVDRAGSRRPGREGRVEKAGSSRPGREEGRVEPAEVEKAEPAVTPPAGSCRAWTLPPWSNAAAATPLLAMFHVKRRRFDRPAWSPQITEPLRGSLIRCASVEPAGGVTRGMFHVKHHRCELATSSTGEIQDWRRHDGGAVLAELPRARRDTAGWRSPSTGPCEGWPRSDGALQGPASRRGR